MIHPSDSDLLSLAVRDGRLAPVTCAACGCRLDPSGDAYVHFQGLAGRDARGCRIDCAEAMHDASGRPIALPV
ncbi:MAG TPA: hypothetical protein VF494_08980 [Candidatus Limnocylindrales bacterium]